MPAKGIVLVCSLLLTPDLADCNPKNAVAVLSVPATFTDMTACLMNSQFYAAGNSVTADLASDQRIMVVCRDQTSIEAEK